MNYGRQFDQAVDPSRSCVDFRSIFYPGATPFAQIGNSGTRVLRAEVSAPRVLPAARPRLADPLGAPARGHPRRHQGVHAAPGGACGPAAPDGRAGHGEACGDVQWRHAAEAELSDGDERKQPGPLS